MEEFLGSLRIITNGNVLLYILKGVGFTLVLAVLSVLLGLLIGSVMGVARNYCNGKGNRIFGWLATAYIEIFRNTPLMLWIFMGILFLPAPAFSSALGLSSVEWGLMYKVTVALTLWTSSVIAEIVRGGLNSVAKGQFEAGYSQGFSFLQIMFYIVIPQAFQNIIPTLLSQIITTIKDTSYFANVATIELLQRVKMIISTAGDYNGLGYTSVSDVFLLFGFACIIYFAINFTLSCLVRKLQKRGVRAERNKNNQTEKTSFA